MENVLLIAFLAFCVVYCLVLPAVSLIYVRRTYPRRMLSLDGQPEFHVNLIVPCKGAGEHLEENLRAIALQDYPRLSLRFVTDDADDPAVPVIERIIRETGKGEHLVCGRDEHNTCGKNLAQLVAIAADRESAIHLVCDSDLRPSPSFVREMARPYLDPSVNVTCSTRWITPPGPGLAAWVYTELAAFSPMLMALPVSYIWGGCFSIRRSAFDEWDVARAWRGTEDDDLVLCNKLNERGQKPFFVPTAVSASFEAHSRIGGLVRWLTRQGQTTRLHYFPAWLALLFIESALSLGVLISAAYAAAIIVEAGPAWQAAAALAPTALLMINGLFVRAPYADRQDMALPLWLVMPLVGHAIFALSFLLAIKPTMRWGEMTLEFNKDGTIRDIRGAHSPEQAAIDPPPP
jgi:ceramide glucosyltransferase